MDFNWTRDQQAFRQKLHDFLASILPDDWEEFSKHGPASPALTRFPMRRGATMSAPTKVLRAWRVGLAAESAGLLAAALRSVTAYLSERKQFGRPLAMFQALRHRLAEAQVLTNGVYWLALRAAGTGDVGDVALAACHAQEAARRVVHDCHRFLGAMGMTLEHPLHLWTYRLKALSSELGGRSEQALAAADAL